MTTGPGWRVGSLMGIPVHLGRSWVLVAALVIGIFAPSLVHDLGAGTGYAVAAGYALLLLISVLVHEAAHAVAAKAVGFRVTRIVADFWGGHTAYHAQGATPARSALVAVVGPLSNAVLAVLGWVAMGMLDGVSLPLQLLAYAFAWSNGFVAVFNLIPGLPLDGGFLLESLVWGATGRRHVGTMVAAWAGRLTAVGLAVYGLWPLIAHGERVSIVRLLWVLLIASFIWRGGSAALRTSKVRGGLSRHRMDDLLRPAAAVPLETTLDRVDWSAARIWVVTDASGAPVGVVDVTSLNAVPRDAWPVTTVSAVARRQPAGWVTTAEPGADVTPAAEALSATAASNQVGAVAVVDRAGTLRGVVLAEDLLKAVPAGGPS